MSKKKKAAKMQPPAALMRVARYVEEHPDRPEVQAFAKAWIDVAELALALPPPPPGARVVPGVETAVNR